MQLEDQEERKIRELKEQQNKVLAQVREKLATMPPPDLQAVNPSKESIERERKRQALVKLLAEIEKRINEENARPRKRYISPSTREEVYAIYYDDLRRKIEDRGTSNFPEAGGRKLYGALTMVITVNHTGKVLELPRSLRPRATPRWTAVRRPSSRASTLALSTTPCAVAPIRSWSFRASDSPARLG